MQFFANTGFLFAGLSLPDRVRAAAAAGFDGVEFHDEVQRHDAGAVAALLAQTGLAVGSLNTRMGETAGCAALPGCEADFAADLTSAHAAAEAVGARAIHVVAGRGVTDDTTYRANLRRALDLTDRQLLIEPISRAAIASYHLHRIEAALDLRAALGPRVAILFDWFHITAEYGAEAAAALLARHRAEIGHVQSASYPARSEPPPAQIAATAALGFGAVGLEYRATLPEAQTLPSLRGSARRDRAP